MKGENAITAFLPMNMKIGGLTEYVKEKAELQCVANVDTDEQEIEQEKLSWDNTDVDINIYYETTTNKIEQENVNTSHVEHLSILSNLVNYVQYERPKEWTCIKH